MIVRKLRLERGWSQETLAQVSGLNVRTIQRIERGHKAGLETLQALAAVLEVDVSELSKEHAMQDDSKGGSRDLTVEEEEALEYVRDLKAFYQHLGTYVVMILFLGAVNLATSTRELWFLWAAVGWGIGVVFHGLNVHEKFNFLGPDWERERIRKRLGRKPGE